MSGNPTQSTSSAHIHYTVQTPAHAAAGHVLAAGVPLRVITKASSGLCSRRGVLQSALWMECQGPGMWSGVSLNTAQLLLPTALPDLAVITSSAGAASESARSEGLNKS